MRGERASAGAKVNLSAWWAWLLTHEHHVVVHAVHMDRLHEVVEAAFPVCAVGRAGVVLEKVTEELQVRGDSRC